MKLRLVKWMIISLLVVLAGCAHNNFGVPNPEWETRRAGLGENPLNGTPPSAGPNSQWAASTSGAWAVSNNPAGMVRKGSHVSGAVVYGSHAHDVAVSTGLTAQTTYNTIANGSRVAAILGGAKQKWAVGACLSFPSDFAYEFSDAGQYARSSGLIGQLGMAGAVNLSPNWRLGAELDGLLGSQSLDAQYSLTNINEKRDYSGYDYCGGIQYETELWRGIRLGLGGTARRGASLNRSDTGTMQLPPLYTFGIAGSYGIYRASAEVGYRSWSETTTGSTSMDELYKAFVDEMRAGGAVDFLLGERSYVSVGYQRGSVPVRNDDGFRMFESRYGVGGAFPVEKGEMSLGLWFGNRGTMGRDGSSIYNIILSSAISF